MADEKSINDWIFKNIIPDEVSNLEAAKFYQRTEPGQEAIYAEPTPAQKAQQFGREAVDYVRGNIMGRPPEGKWIDPKHERVSGREQERLYAEPEYNWEIGEVDPVFHGGGKFLKFSDEFMKSGTGGHVFGWGHYLSEEAGVAKYYEDLYSAGLNLSVNGKQMTGRLSTNDWIDALKPNPLYDDPENSYHIFHGVEAIKNKLNSGESLDEIKKQLATSLKKHPDSKRGKIIKSILYDNDIKQESAGFYKAKLFPGKTEGKDYYLLDWDKPLDEGTLEKVARQFKKEGVNPTGRDINMLLGGLWKSDRYPSLSYYKGKDFYEMLNDSFGSKEAASKFLDRAGIDGIRYPVGTLSGGSKTTPGGKELRKLMDLLNSKYETPMNRGANVKAPEEPPYVWVVNAAQGSKEHINKIESVLRDSGKPDLLNKYLKALDNWVEPKNYVIFNPKNIKIEEGPGFRRIMQEGKPVKAKGAGTWTPPEHPKFQQLEKGAKPVKGVSEQMAKYGTKLPPGKALYHGRVKGVAFEKGKPIFLTHTKRDARFYKTRYGDKGEIIEFESTVKNPASHEDLIETIEEVKATKKDIQLNSPYEGENINDYLYVPDVVNNLKKKGFDGFKGYDVLGNDEIPITVAFDIKKLNAVNKPSKFRQLQKGEVDPPGIKGIKAASKTLGKSFKPPKIDDATKAFFDEHTVDAGELRKLQTEAQRHAEKGNREFIGDYNTKVMIFNDSLRTAGGNPRFGFAYVNPKTGKLSADLPLLEDVLPDPTKYPPHLKPLPKPSKPAKFRQLQKGGKPVKYWEDFGEKEKNKLKAAYNKGIEDLKERKYPFKAVDFTGEELLVLGPVHQFGPYRGQKEAWNQLMVEQGGKRSIRLASQVYDGKNPLLIKSPPRKTKTFLEKQLQKGAKPVKGTLSMPKGMALDTSIGNLSEARTVRDRGTVTVPDMGPSTAGLPKGKMGMLAYEQRKARILNGMEEVQVNRYQKSVKGAANYFHAFNDDISEQSTNYLKWVDKNRNKSAIHVNGKTGISIDISTDCPNRLTGACPHCYVEPARVDLAEAKKAGLFTGTHGKKIVETPYHNEIMGMPSDLVNAINRDGGLRMFSAGDYRGRKMFKGPDGVMRNDYDQVKLMLEHAKEKNLFIKAITKQKEFIDDFASHPNLRINLSTDDLPRIMSNAPTIEEAVQWAGKHKNVKIRSVAFNKEQAIKHLEDERYDVVTMYHGPTNFLKKESRNAYLNPKNKLYVTNPKTRKMIENYPWDPEYQMYRTNKMMQTIELGNKEMVKRAGRDAIQKETDTWVNHAPGKGVMAELDKKYPGRLCCTGAKCPKGGTKCGFGLGMATLIAGIYLPEWETENGE